MTFTATINNWYRTGFSFKDVRWELWSIVYVELGGKTVAYADEGRLEASSAMGREKLAIRYPT